MKVDGMWITNCYYHDFVKLKPKQKDTIRKLKKDPNFESKTNISGMIETRMVIQITLSLY